MTPETLNTPIWGPKNPKTQGAFQEVWYMKMNDPANGRALWLRFTLLVSSNGFRKISETWAVFFQRNAQKEVTKVALKQTHDLAALQLDGDGVRIAESEFRGNRTKGSIQSKGRSIEWDLTLTPGQKIPFNMVPESLKRAGVVKNTAVTVHEDVYFSGTTRIDGQVIEWNSAPGMQGHLSGTKNGHSWVWGHCNTFVNDQNQPVPFIFEGLTARARVAGPMPLPALSAFFFFYKGQGYAFNSLWDAVRLKSSHTLTEWTFQADRGDLSFRGRAKAEHKDFAGLTYEDTNGSLIYCANSKLSDMQVVVYRRGKLDAAFYANGSAAFEVVSRHKNPYVPLLL